MYNSGEFYDGDASVFTVPVNGVYEFGLRMHAYNRTVTSTTADKQASLAVGTYKGAEAAAAEPELKAVTWIADETSGYMTATEVLSKGDKIAAYFRGETKSLDGWISGVTAEEMNEIPFEFFGRLVSKI
jgi:hypothetical protein